jgi:hypothetical protein
VEFPTGRTTYTQKACGLLGFAWDVAQGMTRLPTLQQHIGSVARSAIPEPETPAGGASPV